MDKLKGYRTYIFLFAALLVLVLAGTGAIKLAEGMVDKVVMGLLAAAGVFLRAAVADGKNGK